MTYDVSITRQQVAQPALPWATYWSTRTGLGDWRVAPARDPINPGGLDASEQLEAAVIISLFTDLRAPEGWRQEVQDRRGWWGDAVAPDGFDPEPIGSHLWLLRNETATGPIAELARVYAEASLQWLLRDRVASRVTVTSGLIENPRRGVWLGVEIAARDGALIYDRRFENIWREVS